LTIDPSSGIIKCAGSERGLPNAVIAGMPGWDAIDVALA
jgi:hypothetical protein